MSEELLIHCSAQETRVAVMVNGILEDLHIERRAQRGLVGNVYKGKVMRVLPGMQSAFIDIGLERTAFLHVHDIFTARQDDGTYKPIEYVLHEGESVIVQVSKDPIGTKGARLTTTISLAGHKLVYLPKEPHIGVEQIDHSADAPARDRDGVQAVAQTTVLVRVHGQAVADVQAPDYPVHLEPLARLAGPAEEIMMSASLAEHDQTTVDCRSRPPHRSLPPCGVLRSSDTGP